MIRRATEADLDPITSVDAACFGRPWGRDQVREEMVPLPSGLWVVESAGHVVGFACLRSVPPEAELLRLAVLPAQRRRGWGGDLLRGVCAMAQSAGVTTIHLEVAAGNRAARELYARHGFVEVGRRRGYYRDPPDDAVLMRREPAGAP